MILMTRIFSYFEYALQDLIMFYLISAHLENIVDGLTRYKFRDEMRMWMRRYRGVLDTRRTVDTLETEYTNWVHPNNDTARRQMAVDVSCLVMQCSPHQFKKGRVALLSCQNGHRRP
jgi:hypothetical protein